jgi:glucose-1-phosphate thymidylyltransferase
VKGLLLAGGHGTRLRPLTYTGNKHMLPIGNKPILLWGLEHLRDAGVTEIGIILGPIREGIEEAVGDGSALGVKVTYIAQGEPKGLAHAILCARDFLGNEPFVMYLGDNMLEHGIGPYLERYARGDASAVVGAVAVKDPTHYGVVELGPGDSILSIEEKPKAPKSDLALIGVYLFSPEVHEVVRELRPSARGELEITDAIRALEGRTHRVRVLRLEGWWKDTGRPEDLIEANERVLDSRPPAFFQRSGKIHPHAHVSGPIAVGRDTVVGEGCTLRGPLVLGKGVVVDDGAYVGPYTSVGDRSVIRRAEVERSILMEEVVVDLPTRIVDSILGRGCKVLERPHGPRGTSLIVGDAGQVLVSPGRD